MKTLTRALVAALILISIASPVLADGPTPRPNTLPKASYTGIVPGGGGKIGAARPSEENAEAPSLVPEGLMGPKASGALVFYGWTNLMRFGSAGLSNASWGCVNRNEVCSQGWSSTNQNIYYLRSGNYLCLNGSCTYYTYFSAYWWHWVWAGWRWKSTSWTWWSTTSEHYFNFGSGTFTKYTSTGVIF